MVDDFNLRDLLGEPEDEQSMPVIENVPASQLSTSSETKSGADMPDVADSIRCQFCKCFMVGMLGDKRVCEFHRTMGIKAGDCPKCARRAIIDAPGYIEQGFSQEQLSHPTPPEPNVDLPAPPTPVSPLLLDPEAGDYDAEYLEVFNGSIIEGAPWEVEEIQARQHKLRTMIRRAKIQDRAMQVLMDGKIGLVDQKRRKALQDSDRTYRSQRVSTSELKGAGGKTAGSKKAGTAGLSQVEKQIKQFIKLAMSDDTIIQTLNQIGNCPTNVRELIAKHRG